MFILFYSIIHTCKLVCRDQNHDLCSVVQKLLGVMRQKAGNWQSSWILAAILIFLI